MRQLLFLSVLALGVVFPLGIQKARAEVDLSCMQIAVEKRDNAIITAWDQYIPKVKTSLEKRRDALKAAWAIEEKEARQQALMDAWKVYRSEVQKVRQDMRTGRQSAWKTFNTERKACKATASDMMGDRSNSGADGSL